MAAPLELLYTCYLADAAQKLSTPPTTYSRGSPVAAARGSLCEMSGWDRTRIHRLLLQEGLGFVAVVAVTIVVSSCSVLCLVCALQKNIEIKQK